MQEIERLLTVEDIMRIFSLSRVSVYRRVADAKAKKSPFPIPLEGGPKRSLRWSRRVVGEFCESQAAPQQSVHVANPVKQSKAKQERQQRQKAVSAALLRHGIASPSKKGSQS